MNSKEIKEFRKVWSSTNRFEETKTQNKERLVNFLEEDIKKLEKDIKINNKENIDMFFSYWGQHFNKLKTK